MTIGERIKQLREERDITQTELANAVGASKQTIYKYEKGIVTNIPSEKIELIATYFSVSPAYLMGWTDEPVGFEFGNLLKEARLKKEMSQDELAKALGYESAETIEKIENGEILIPASTMFKACGILDLSFVDLVFPGFNQNVSDREGKETSEDMEWFLSFENIFRKQMLHELLDEKELAEFELVNLFKSLNSVGQQKALDYLLDLSEQDKYTRKDK